MAFYAHAVIEVGDTKFQRGDEVPSDIDGFDELVESGSVREDEEYDPAADEVGPPEVVEIDGVRYVQASDGADTQGASDAR